MNRFPCVRVVLGVAVAVMIAACDGAKAPPPSKGPVAAMTSGAGLKVVIETSESLLWSAAAVREDGSATVIAQGRIQANQDPVSINEAPSGARMRLRFAPAGLPARGETAVWTRTPGDGPVTELPAGSAEFVYPGGEVTLVVSGDRSKLAVAPK